MPTNVKGLIYLGVQRFNMREITTTLKIDKYGRIIIPEYLREKLGLKADDLVEVTLRILEEN